ncbi:MAG: DUF424 family protein [archaeon]|jgi:hypothetical protein
MIAKKHEIEYKTILAVCDAIHLGKTYEDGEIQIKISQQFYGGEKITPEEFKQMVKEADSINLFGDKCVDIALKEGYVSEKSVRKICGIKHALIC